MVSRLSDWFPALALLVFLSWETSSLWVSLAKWGTLGWDAGTGKGELRTSLRCLRCLFASPRITRSLRKPLWLQLPRPHPPHWFQFQTDGPSFWTLLSPALRVPAASYYCGYCVTSLLSFSAGPPTSQSVTCIQCRQHSWLNPNWDTISHSLDCHRFKCPTIPCVDKDTDRVLTKTQRTFRTQLQGVEAGEATLENRWQYLVKLDMGVSCDSTSTSRHIYQTDSSYFHKKVSKIILIAPLFIIANIYKTV